MDAEIELKLFFPPEHKSALTSLINDLNGAQSKGVKQLFNGYFDTPDLQLRRWDMGLRVRGIDDHREQTIKTAGKVAGGIHSRPEYNVTITGDVPDLGLFPAEIWPEGADLIAVQAQLGCVFNTDFSRHSWHVRLGGSLVEIALDQGVIRAGGREEPLCELEFELLEGHPGVLLTLAQQLANKVPLRLGKASKAQRGYQLAGKGKAQTLDALAVMPLARDLELGQCFALLLETALERWQLLEAMIAASVDQPQNCADLWQRLLACINLLESTLSQFGMLEPVMAEGFAEVRAQLDFVDDAQALAQLAGNQQQIFGRRSDATELSLRALQALVGLNFANRLQNLWQLPAYGQLQLQLVSMMLEGFKGGNGTLADFASGQLEAAWEKIHQAMPLGKPLSLDEYRQAGRALDAALLVGLAYGNLFPMDSRRVFRAPWEDLRQGILVLLAYGLMGQMCGDNGELQQWLADKTQSLAFAMEQSRQVALKQLPYWR
ncbi:CYTH domain-containing protein [Shewanella sedimentimangrovi]|uniref:CYTH domain-containing protein n=1 Tax=Shewanella sedimentimangrovi TaxID=2814293 RepID=A0ABX7R487_9GAMM|nr:CYTH and CHAD domain-containing protein [Shewanella sedimentimangrovi]QSX37976.1 CYTH domain-containing protein [Shewanella sedimentimangrovi]